MNLSTLSILQVRNPVEFHGVQENLIPSNSMELKRPSISTSVISLFKLQHSQFAAGANLEGLGYGE